MLMPIFLLIFGGCSAYKMVLLAPAMVNSQVMFNKRVAETLTNAGHDVTIALIYPLDGLDPSDIKIPKNVKVYHVDAKTGHTKQEMDELSTKMAFTEPSFLNSDMRNELSTVVTMLHTSCRKTLQNKEFMTWLKESKFDLAFVHFFHACPMGLAYTANIPFVWLHSGAFVEVFANIIGVPTIPSYVPPFFMPSHDSMTFLERTKSFIGQVSMIFLWKRGIADPETRLFREEVDPNFPDLTEVLKNCSLVMVNSNPLYDLPRPTLAKVIEIGGIGMQSRDAKPLPKELEEIVNQGDGAIVMSFGSVAPIYKMPPKWKDALLAAFGRLSHLQFIIRYTETDLDDRLPQNVQLMKWLPQTDLLQHPRVKAFISHGGYNSFQEAIAAGKPLIMIPLSSDQPKNAKIAEKHGIARILLKSDFNEENLVNHITAVTKDPSYAKGASRLSAMVAKQPISSEKKLVKWAELLADFKTLENLRPAGVDLNFVQYHSLDVVFVLLVVFSIILYLLFVTIRCIFRYISKKISLRTEK